LPVIPRPQLPQCLVKVMRGRLNTGLTCWTRARTSNIGGTVYFRNRETW
jgi:hypothetical protein